MAIKVIAIDDFSGGKNLYDNQAMIANNQCASASYNVWAPRKMLTKMPGFTTLLATTASAGGGGIYNNSGGIFADDNVNTSYSLYNLLTFTNVFNAAVTAGLGLWGGQTDSLVPLGYNVGTISISGASLVSATGSGTTWTTNILAGDLMVVNTTSSAYYTISSVEDNTHLTLSGPVGVAVATGSAYNICLQTHQIHSAISSFNQSLWISTTADSLQRYDGTKMTRIASGQAAAFLQVHQNYMFAARTSTATSRLYWSTVRDPTSWPTNNFIDIDKDRGIISGLYAYQNELIVFKTRSMYKVVGSTFDSANATYAVYPIAVPSYFMFNSPASIAVWRGQLIFFADNHLFTYRPGTFYITKISDMYYQDFTSSYKSLLDLDGALAGIAGINFHDYYILNAMLYANTTYNGGILDKNGSWWYFTDSNQANLTNVGAWGSYGMAIQGSSSSNASRIIATTTGSKGRAHVWDILGPTYATNTISVSTGAAIAIAAQWVSKEFNIEYGTFKSIIIYLQKQTAGNLTVQWSIDQAANVSYTLDMTKGRGTVIRAVIPIQQKGTSIQITLSNSTVSQTFNIYGIKILYEESPMERIL